MPNPKTTFLIFNGPPKSGKTTAAKLAVDLLTVGNRFIVNTDSFAAPMKHFIATTLADQYHNLEKDSPMAVLSGYSPREFLIDLSETYLKSKYGDDFFGRALMYRQLRYSPLPDFVVVDDSGFVGEVEALSNQARVVRMVRPGCDFSNDSRGYLPHLWWQIMNNGTMAALYESVQVMIHNLVIAYDHA